MQIQFHAFLGLGRGIALGSGLPAAFAQSDPAYMAFGPTKAMFYKPDAGPAPRCMRSSASDASRESS